MNLTTDVSATVFRRQRSVPLTLKALTPTAACCSAFAMLRCPVLICLVTAFLFPAEAFAQAVDIRSRDGNQVIVHSLTSQPQAFSGVRWDLQNSFFDNGCIVQWTSAAFQHETAAGFFADCELNVKLTQSQNRADWVVTVPSDISKIASGKKSATVTAASSGRGNARAELVVRMWQSDVDALAAGNYSATVVGTISGF
ncbi:MAG: hypothetical protein KDA89_18135 [Planctomycetaceae bacterium]|nr:hypothetical protein [Planctomycetaceae bacterium]